MQDPRAAAKSKRKKTRAKEKGSEVHQNVKRVRPRWAYISCRRAGLSHTRYPRVASSASPRSQCSWRGIVGLTSRFCGNPLGIYFYSVGRFDRGVELGVFGREWREGDGFAIGRPLPLDHRPWLIDCEGGLNGLAC